MNSSGGIHSPGRKTRRRRIGAPVTPPLHWKSQPTSSKCDSKRQESSEAGTPFWRGRQVGLSARKLAAGLWQLQLPAEVLKCCKYGSGSECGSFEGLRLEHESHFPYQKPSIEGLTKWDRTCFKTSEAYHFQSHAKLLENKVKGASVISSLQAELVQAQSLINQQEAELLSTKKKIRYLLRKLGEERSSEWRREFDKSLADTNELKDELRRERKNQQKLESENSKLIKELAKAKVSAKQFKYDYEEEKKAREILEGVCNELSKKLEEDKAQFEALEQETLKLQEGLEEERNMLQMAEVWREERIQMKLADARLALENKYAKMNTLMSVLETFLRSRIASLDMTELREAEQMIQTVKSVNIQDTKEFDYLPSRAKDVVSIIEEIQQADSCERKTEPSGSICHDNGYVENQASSNSLEGIDPSPKRGINALRNGLECNVNDSQSESAMRVEVCSASAKQSRQKVSPAKLGRSVPISDEGKGRLSNATIANAGTISPHRKSVEYRPSVGTISPRRKSTEGRLKQGDSIGHRGSLEPVDPHIVRGMKGWIEWPSGILKKTLKAKESQKSSTTKQNQR